MLSAFLNGHSDIVFLQRVGLELEIDEESWKVWKN